MTHSKYIYVTLVAYIRVNAQIYYPVLIWCHGGIFYNVHRDTDREPYPKAIECYIDRVSWWQILTCPSRQRQGAIPYHLIP